MNFIKGKVKDIYLLDTKIENFFINEYMPIAPAEYVKVYLFAAMYAEHDIAMTNEVIAMQLGLTEEDIQGAWNYWEEKGIIKKHYLEVVGKFNYSVEFMCLKEMIYGKTLISNSNNALNSEKKLNIDNEDIKNMFSSIEGTLSRALSSAEIEEVNSWIKDYAVTPEIIIFAFVYCAEREKTNIKYIDKVIRGWTEKEFKTIEAVQEYLNDVDQMYYKQKRVMKALGFTRNATEAERAIIDKWFDEMKFTMERVLDACNKTAGISNPNINYVNKVLENWQKEAGNRNTDINSPVTVNQSILNKYYSYLRKTAEEEAEIKRKNIYAKLPKIKEIDSEIKKLSSLLSKTLILGTGNNEEGKKIRGRIEELTGDRAVILTENNYDMNYTDVKYFCEKCNDTGMTDFGEKCTCIKQRIEEAEQWRKK